ncbi:hypothetical protein BELL_0275g00110 [Botrytis elliptica]|uniref:Uncharacterized protein n=1 Tax=Botrytis elliptica TaxID=278938 RepID=A0A4Z1JM22_9HELO|nr:hypothetical protein EAE99_005661 [Botrytis elliptica]TGO74526.1 hypothetical protein BELL_0275g00110 [Botrytis elliptica]
MEDENQASNVQLQSSEHEELIEERSEEKSPITEVCEIIAPGTSGSVTPEVETPEEDLSDIDARSDENSPCKETYGSEVTQHTSGRDSAENKPQENELPNSPDLDLQLSTTDIPEERLSEPKVPGDSLEVEITQHSEHILEPVEIEVPQLLSPSPEPIEIDIPERSDCSSEVPRLPELPDNEPQDHSGSDADNECSDEEPLGALGDWQLRKLAENALEIALDVSTPKAPVSSISDPNICKPRTPLPDRERVWRPSSTDATRANKPKCPPCERKKKRFDCLGSPPCNECSKRNMTAEQCSTFAFVRRRGKKRLQDDDGMVAQKGGKRGKRR